MIPLTRNDNRRSRIVGEILEFCRGPENTLRTAQADRAWAEPLVGFSRGDDPLYEAYKEYVGPFHWTPVEIFRRTFPDSDAEASELTVISWVLPQTSQTKHDNRNQKVYPAESWARSRIYGEAFNCRLREHVVITLSDLGHESVAPHLSPAWETTALSDYGYASTWSERHAAYASGLGTFGLCDGLITPRGKAVRVGSVVARVQLPTTPRLYDGHQEFCLFMAEGTCGQCMDRCPVGAITETGHDKETCERHLSRTREFVRKEYGFEGYGCGLCQTGVPCESARPIGAHQ